MYNELSCIPYLRYRIESRVIGPLLYLPPIYETLGNTKSKAVSRGRVLYSMIRDSIHKQFPCLLERRCDDCNRRSSCDWIALFSHKTTEQIFHFSIVPSFSPKKIYRAGEFFDFELKLMGKGAFHELFAERFMPAIEMAGLLKGIGNWIDISNANYGRFQVERVFVENDGKWKQIFDHATDLLDSNVDPQALGCMLDFDQNKVYDTIRWVTPFCFLKQGELLQELSLENLLYFVRQRLKNFISSPENFPLERIKIIEEYLEPIAALKGRSYNIGYTKFEKIPTRFIPYLIAGSFLHLGRNVRHGYGVYVLE